MESHVSWVIELAVKDGALGSFTELMHEMVAGTSEEPNTPRLRVVHLGGRGYHPHLREVRRLRGDDRARHRLPGEVGRALPRVRRPHTLRGLRQSEPRGSRAARRLRSDVPRPLGRLLAIRVERRGLRARERVVHEQLEVLQQAFAPEQEPSLPNGAGAKAAVHRLDEVDVLLADDRAELGDLCDHLVRRAGRPEPVDVGARRTPARPARTRARAGWPGPGRCSASSSARRSGTGSHGSAPRARTAGRARSRPRPVR